MCQSLDLFKVYRKLSADPNHLNSVKRSGKQIKPRDQESQRNIPDHGSPGRKHPDNSSEQKQDIEINKEARDHAILKLHTIFRTEFPLPGTKKAEGSDNINHSENPSQNDRNNHVQNDKNRDPRTDTIRVGPAKCLVETFQTI